MGVLQTSKRVRGIALGYITLPIKKKNFFLKIIAKKLAYVKLILYICIKLNK